MKEERINKPPILKVGDKVRVKSKEWFDAQEQDSEGNILLKDLTPKGLYFIPKMIGHCGKEFFITTIVDREPVPYYIFKDSKYNWEFWMFDLIEDVEEPEYKVGDKIIVNSIEWYDKNKDDCGIIDLEDGGNFVGSMKEHCGKEFTISDSYERDNQIYYHFKETGWAWQSWMFSPVKKEVSPDIIAKSDAHNIEVGDEVTCVEDFGKAIVIFSGIVCQVYTIDTKEVINVRKDLLKVVNKGPYVAYIDVSKTTTEKIATLHELLDKKSNSSAYNSSEFDLTKVIYKSKRIY